MNVAVVIGVFDGVHRGHQVLLQHAREAVGEQGRVVALTFDPHPTVVVAPTRVPPLLTSIEERKVLLKAAGADDVVEVSFTGQLSQLTAEQFVDDVLMPLDPTLVCVGGNFRFGHGAAADVATLTELGAARGFATHGVALAGGAETPWSSTRARALIAAGEMDQVRDILGRDYQLCGEVLHGDARGRELGFPTANLNVPTGRAVPSDGVYAGWLVVRSERYAAAISVGTNPQFNGVQRRIEAHALDVPVTFDIYGEKACVAFVARLRGQQVYADVDALVAAIAADVARVREILAASAAP